MIIFWLFIFVLSLILLVKGADWFVENSEKIGIAIGISPFIIGVTVVAIGTSFPELVSSLVAAIKGATEMVSANVIGSNIANILLIVGLSAIMGKRLAVKRSLIDIDLPLLASTTVLFGFILWDRKIFWQESLLLLLAFLVYLFYTIQQRTETPLKPLPEEIVPGEIYEILPSRADRRMAKERPKKVTLKTIFFLIIGLIFLIVGANYLVDAVLKLSTILNISTSIITILAVAVGTSLPELAVSVRAAWEKKYEIALGNIFGSNVFNVLVVTALPGLIKTLFVDNLTLTIGFPFMAISTLLLVISGITRRISIWEGSMFLIIYILFVIKLFALF